MSEGAARPHYFLSDTHIADPDSPRTRRLLDFLRARRGEAEAVYLVGDIFEVWLGHRSSLYSAFFPLLRVLAELVEGGTRVVLFSGNHDPDPGPFFEQLGVEVQEAPLWLNLGGRWVHVEHGDTIHPNPLRRLPNQAARARWVRWLARRLHPDLSWWGGTRWGRMGLNANRPNQPLPGWLVEHYFPGRVAAGAEVAIIGHFHRAFAHRAIVRGRPRLFFVLGDWIAHCTYLRWAGGRFELLRHRPGRPPLPATDPSC